MAVQFEPETLQSAHQGAAISDFWFEKDGFAFTDPFSVGFENGEYFLLMGNHFAFEHAACDLVNLVSSMLAITFDFKLQKSLGGR